ncbi:MAG: peptidylprolyl isomerase [Flavobacteriales bacterium]|jgi:peptidyl-prolyl cis-trans isomerase B (cyclophilin B)|nr:peptidylprolyl isomerase [Flavobacteriales bacterium]
MKLFIYAFFLIFLWACSSNSNTETPTKTLPKKLISRVVDSAAIRDSIEVARQIAFQKTLITEENVTERLTKFGQENPETKIKIKTKYGSIKLRLYEDTPLHRANFIMLIKKGYFDSTLFYRVIENFMIQGGNSDSDNIGERMRNIGLYHVPEEIRPHHIHKRGAIAMAVQDQSDRAEELRHKNSSAYNFYIIQKGPLSNAYMEKLEKRYKMTIPAKNRAIYRKYGGNPHLDNQYTVFGEVYSGFNTLDKISKVLVDHYDRPKKDIFLTIEIIE